MNGCSSSCPSWIDAVARLGHLVPGAREVAERLRDDEPRLVGDASGAPRPRGAARAACPRASSRRASATCPRSSSGTPRRARRRSSPRSSGSGARRRASRPTSSISPTARSTAPGGSSSSPSVSARKKNTSESVEPSIAGYSAGRPRARGRASRSWKSRITPVVHPQPAAVAERMAVRLLDRRSRTRRGCARTRAPDSMCAARSRRFRSFQAGSTLWKTPGVSPYAVPADAEAVAVRRLGAELRVEALVDQRVLRLVEQLLEEDRRARVCEPAAHQCAKAAPVASSWTGAGCLSSRGSWRSRSATSMSARSWVKPRRTTTRSAARSVRFSGNV